MHLSTVMYFVFFEFVFVFFILGATNAPCHNDLFCIFEICIFVFYGELTHLATVMMPDPSGVQTLFPATSLFLIEAVMLVLIRTLILMIW